MEVGGRTTKEFLLLLVLYASDLNRRRPWDKRWNSRDGTGRDGTGILRKNEWSF